MKLPLVALAAMVSVVVAQGVTESIAPSATPPASCKEDYDGSFGMKAVSLPGTQKRGIEERAAAGLLTMKLKGGILTDSMERIGYIASNYQFQFDGPPQAGAIYTAGFSVCSNGSLALGGSTIWYQCLSGSFYNLYDRHWADQCGPIALEIMPAASAGTTSPAPLTATTPTTETESVTGSAPVKTTILTTASNSTASAASASASAHASTGATSSSPSPSPSPSATGAGGEPTGTAAAAAAAPTSAAVAVVPMAGIAALAVGILGAVVLM